MPWHKSKRPRSSRRFLNTCGVQKIQYLHKLIWIYLIQDFMFHKSGSWRDHALDAVNQSLQDLSVCEGFPFHY